MESSCGKYSAMTVKQLTEELRKKKAKVSGRKKDLVESYDRNDNFGAVVNDKVEFNIALPDKALYKDIHRDSIMPNVSINDVTTYLSLFNTPLQDKAKNLYNNRFLSYARQTTQEDTVYVHAKCHAEMKKGVCYFIDITLDQHGIVQQSQCDCAAGMGPDGHCKHIQTILWGLVCWSQSGQLKTEETCTQRLQTFHRAKKLTGSPAKCRNLQLGTENKFNFDPRPTRFRNNPGYADFVKNLVTNSQISHRMPIDTTIIPANTHAIVDDHTYSSYSLEEQFLTDMNITSISQETVSAIEELTRSQADCKEWTRERCVRLTASNFGKICRATDRTNFKGLALTLTKYTETYSAPLNHGKKYESVAIAKLEQQNQVSTKKCGLVISIETPIIACSPDALLGEDIVIEVKCPWVSRDREITPVTVPYLLQDGDQLTLSKNHNYYYQVQGQLYCTQRSKCIFVVYTFKDFKVIEIAKDDLFIAEMKKKLSDFYENYFKFAVLKRFLHHSYRNYTFQPDAVF